MIHFLGRARTTGAMAVALGIALGASGCRHRTAQPVLLPAQTPVAIDVPPPPANPPMVEAPKTKLPPVPVVKEIPETKKTKQKRAKSVAAAPGGGAAPGTTQSASVQPPAAAQPAGVPVKTGDAGGDGVATVAPGAAAATPESIGVFTVGGDQSPRVKQDATNLIAANERRLAGMTDRSKSDPALVSKVRNFQKEAQQALNSGDAAGARTLATKGKLLLDDIERGVASQ